MACYRDFPFNPDYTVEQTPEHKVNVSQFESGKKQVYWKGRYPRRWKLSFSNRDYSVAHQILKWWDDQHGPAIPFYWEYLNPLNNGRETVLVRFVEASPPLSTKGTYSGSLSLTVEEVLS